MNKAEILFETYFTVKPEFVDDDTWLDPILSKYPLYWKGYELTKYKADSDIKRIYLVSAIRLGAWNEQEEYRVKTLDPVWRELESTGKVEYMSFQYHMSPITSRDSRYTPIKAAMAQPKC